MTNRANYQDKILEYYDEVAPIYGFKHGADRRGGRYSFHELYSKVLRQYITPGDSVLELGCGNGASTEMLVNLGANVLATDISEEMTKVASQRGLKNVEFAVLDASTPEDFPENKTFDVIAAFNTFSYYPNKEEVLRSLHRLLKPSGKLIILDMNPLCPLYPVMAWYGKNEMNTFWQVIRETTPANLRRLCQATGYKIRLLTTLNFVPHALDGIRFQTLRAVNPILNALPLVKRLAMRVLLVAEKQER